MTWNSVQRCEECNVSVDGAWRMETRNRQSAGRAASLQAQKTSPPGQRRDVPPDYPAPARCVMEGETGCGKDDPATFPSVRRQGAPLLEEDSQRAVVSQSR